MTDIVTSAQLLAEVGVSRQMLSKWAKEGLRDVARVSHGKWDREAALTWIGDRREDSPNLDGGGVSRHDIAEQRCRLYRLQGDGQEMRNALLDASVVFRDSVETAVAEVCSEQIMTGDAWARDPSSPAAKPLLEHVSAAQVIALKTEIWNELRTHQAAAVRRISGILAAGENVGSARTRLPGRMGGR